MLTKIDLEHCPILIVDDEPQNVDLLKRMLRREGYTEIHTTTEPAKVTGLYQELLPDLVLLDLNMPEMDGFEVMKALQNQFPGKELNIIVITALDGQTVRRNALDAGAKDFITKPVDRSELLTRIRNHLQTYTLNKQLESQNDDLAKANNKLAELNQSMTDLVSIVSHELRTPLTAIKSFAEILRDDDKNLSAEERSHFLSIIDNESDRLSRLISDLLDLQKIEAGKMQWGMEQVDLVSVTRDTVEFFSPTYNNKGLSIELTCELDKAIVITDPDKLRQVIYNLFSNALKFTGQGGATISLTRNDSWAHILLLSHNADIVQNTEKAAHSLHANITTLTDPGHILDQLNQAGGQIDLLIIDSQSRSEAGTEVIDQVWEQYPALPVITINEERQSEDEISAQGDMAIQIADLIGLPPSHAMLELSIRDSGQGIPKDQLSKVFERFHQVDTSQTREQRGTGLGLTICQQIVKHYHGKMWVESEYGEGSTFHLLLPAELEEKKKLGEILVEKGLVTKQQLTDALKGQ